MDKAVLLIIFNRPKNTEMVFNEIRKAKPKRFYIAGDGPRKGFPDDLMLTKKAREIINKIDWPCEVRTLFQKNNLGCKEGPYAAINWFFENEEEGIILEDDCVPDKSFFDFCDKLLGYYKEDERVMMICGTNYLVDTEDYQFSYFFANYFPIWGWATWKRAWNMYDKEIKEWDRFKEIKQMDWIFTNEIISKYYTNMFQLIKDGFDAWDIQWWFTCIFQHGLAIVPSVNLVKNIGEVGTHSSTQGDFFINAPTESINLQSLKHPPYMTPDINLNKEFYKKSHAHLDVEKVPKAVDADPIICGKTKKQKIREFIKGLIKS